MNEIVNNIVNYYSHQFFYRKKILDLGSGQGDVSGPLVKLGASVTCLDVRQEHLKIASKKYPGIKIIKHMILIKIGSLKKNLIL